MSLTCGLGSFFPKAREWCSIDSDTDSNNAVHILVPVASPSSDFARRVLMAAVEQQVLMNVRNLSKVWTVEAWHFLAVKEEEEKIWVTSLCIRDSEITSLIVRPVSLLVIFIVTGQTSSLETGVVCADFIRADIEVVKASIFDGSI